MINAFRVTRRGGDSIGWRENLQKEAVGLYVGTATSESTDWG